MSEINIKSENGADILQIIPQGVCSRLMQLKIKDNKILDSEFVGGCSGNLGGIKILILGMDINDVVRKLADVPCGNRGTSCPDQLARGLKAYIEQKQTVNA